MVLSELPERIHEESLNTVRNAIVTLTQERDQFQKFIDEMLDGLEDIRQEIDHRESELATTRTELATKKAEMDRALADIHGQHEVNEQRRQQLEDISNELSRCHEQISALEIERDESRARMEEAVSELESVAGVLDIVQSTQDELHQTREELLDARAKLRQQEDEPSDQELESLRRSNKKLQGELRQSRLDAERLSEQVEVQNNQLTEYRERLAKDLSGLRNAMQKRAESLRQEPASTVPDAPSQQAVVECVLETDEWSTHSVDEESWPSTVKDEPWTPADDEDCPQEVDVWEEDSIDDPEDSIDDPEDPIDDPEDPIDDPMPEKPESKKTKKTENTDPVIGSVLAKFANIDEVADGKHK